MSGRRRGTMPPDLARRLQDARAATGLGVRRLGREIGVHWTHLRRIERAQRRPSVAVAERLAAALGLDEETTAELLDVAADDAGQSRKGRDGG